MSSPTFAPDLRMAFPDGMLPNAVMEIVSGPAVVSPPMRGQEYWFAIAKRPLAKAPSQTSSTLGRAIAKVNPRGFAPMAARSERLTARALWPNSSGLAPSKKCLPSISISLVIAISSPATGMRRAQSSPIPRAITFSLLERIASAPALKKRWMRSNSPRGLDLECISHFMALGKGVLERNRIGIFNPSDQRVRWWAKKRIKSNKLQP